MNSSFPRRDTSSNCSKTWYHDSFLPPVLSQRPFAASKVLRRFRQLTRNIYFSGSLLKKTFPVGAFCACYCYTLRRDPNISIPNILPSSPGCFRFFSYPISYTSHSTRPHHLFSVGLPVTDVTQDTPSRQKNTQSRNAKRVKSNLTLIEQEEILPDVFSSPSS